ncbi:MAG: beta-ketoacyl synthase chain length factor [Proteobacteria bacterium]|nr:beta-ketoacyl synthase chain length factor [Pseudomonadota bacterium]MBU1585008.1 beta-ketoacyl synthase chain length factor [Pseudomonadota bacterium]
MESIYSNDFSFIKELSGCPPGGGDRLNQSMVDTSPLLDYLPKSRFRRIDHFSRMALLSAGKAIKDTDPSLFPKDNTGVIIATGFGALKTTFSFLDSYIEKGDKLASPTHFSNSVHNAAAAHVSICYGITGPNLTVSQFDMSFFSALMTAMTWLETGKTAAVLLGTADAFCDVLGYCIHRISNSKANQRYSFGEGSAFFLLTRDEEKPRYGYFEDVCIGNYNHSELKIPKDALLVLSPSSIAACNDRFMKYLKASMGRSLFRNQLFSPTDCGMDAVFSTKLSRKICYVKIGRDGEYGKMLITPNLK